jgi:RND superfamily putative drug exporter
VVATAVLAALCSLALAPLVFSALGTGGAAATGTEAERAGQQAERLGVVAPDLVLALSGRTGPEMQEDAQDVVRALSARKEVKAVWSAQTARDPWLRSLDGRTLLVEARLAGSDEERKEAAPGVVAAARSAAPALRVEPSGGAWANREIDAAIKRDLSRAELLAAPALFVVLVFAYGSIVSALLPVMVAVLAVSCTLPLLGLLTLAVEIPRPAVNTAAAIGLGLAVDYSLFLLARFREELGRCGDRESALRAALRSSGRMIAFSAAAIAACLAAAMVVPVPLLRGLSLAGMVTAVLAALVALTVLPACLRLLGPSIERWDPLRRWRRGGTGDGSRFWRRTAHAVTARPVLAGGLAVLVLALLAMPFTHARLGLVDERTLPPSASAATVAERVRTGFAVPPERLLTVVVTGTRAATEVGDYAKRLAGIKDVTDVRVVRKLSGKAAASPSSQAAVLALATGVGPDTRAAEGVVRAVREASAPGAVAVGGRAAEVADTRQAVLDALPLCLLVPAVALLLLLGSYTRTIVAPLKALAVGVVSLGGSLGAIVVLFQDGRGNELLGGFRATGSLDASTLLFVLFITLALSVDYEVFLLGRIREEYLRSGDNRAAIVDGIAHTGRLMTSAAAAVAISTAAMATSEVALLKLIGIGIALGALVDAVLVRGVLVPAVMAALGPANWWTPTHVPTRWLTPRKEKGEG